MANDIESLRVRATELGITFSGNTGAKTLDAKISAHLSAAILGTSEPLPEVIPKKALPKGPPTLAELQIMDLTKIPSDDPALYRSAVRARALVLRRVQIINLDPSDADLSGAVITVMNKYTGKVSKFVPFGEGSEGGYHVPQILLNQLLAQKFVLRKQKKGISFGVKTYKTTMVPKFAITILPDLTPDELKNLADRQAASQSISDE